MVRPGRPPKSGVGADRTAKSTDWTTGWTLRTPVLPPAVPGNDRRPHRAHSSGAGPNRLGRSMALAELKPAEARVIRRRPRGGPTTAGGPGPKQACRRRSISRPFRCSMSEIPHAEPMPLEPRGCQTSPLRVPVHRGQPCPPGRRQFRQVSCHSCSRNRVKLPRQEPDGRPSISGSVPGGAQQCAFQPPPGEGFGNDPSCPTSVECSVGSLIMRQCLDPADRHADLPVPVTSERI